MTKTRNLSDLLDANGDVKLGNLDNVPASNDASALTTGTLPIARIADGDIALAKLSATGTKDATTFLRGDNTFAEAGGGGKVLQVVTGTTTTSSTTTSTSYVATNLTASITPSSTNNKILVLLSAVADTRSSGNEVEYTLYRNGSNILGGAGLFGNHYNSGARQQSQMNYCYLDSPSSTSSLEYKVYHKTVNASTCHFAAEGATASMVLMEIEG